jgi:hypothetical protein
MVAAVAEETVASFRTWVRAGWLRDHESSADVLIAARAVECGVPDGVEWRRLYSPWRKAYLYIWEWHEEEMETITNG